MSDYNWTITKDHIAVPTARPGTNLNAVGMVGPRGATMNCEEIIGHPGAQKFEIYDDDGELYYEGYLVGGDGFEPLDDFGTPNAGATEIRYNGVPL